MRSGFLADAHVDQSHCNFHLREALLADGWTLLFRDSPSHSRGGPGTQGSVLRAVEERGWPIPDLVLVKDGIALVIEIDAVISAAIPSLSRYRALGKELQETLQRVADRPINEVRLGFCRSTMTVSPVAYFESHAGTPVDLLVAFAVPGTPVFNHRPG
jgi:hypothetical protein